MAEKLKSCKCSLHGMRFPGTSKRYMCEVAAQKLRETNENRSRIRRRMGRKEILEQLKDLDTT